MTDAAESRGGRCRTPVLLQSEISECGAASLGSVLGYYGKWVPMGELRDACAVGRDGSSAADILRAARRFGLEARGWRRNIQNLHRIPFPAILFWEFDHFVVLEGVDRGRYYLNDPASGHRVVDYDTMDRCYTGVALQFAKTPAFAPSGRPPGVMRLLWSFLRDFRSSLVLAGVLGLLLAASMLALPLLLTVLVDHVLLQGQAGWGGAIAAALLALGALTYLLVWLQRRLLRRVAIAISIAQSDQFLTHLFQLPLQFFSQRLAGDLLRRVQLIDETARHAAVHLPTLAVETLMSLAFLAVMLAYDPLLAMSLLGLALLLAMLVAGITRQRVDHGHRLRKEQGSLAGVAMAGLRALPSIRATARENGFFARWGGYQAQELQARQSFQELGHLVDALPSLFLMFGSVLVLGVGGWRVLSGEMTPGVLMGFYLMAGYFLRPVGRLMVFSADLQTLSADFRRLEDVISEKPTTRRHAVASGQGGAVATLNGQLKLKGKIELREVTFGFQAGKPPLIENFSLTINPGERVAVVGPTGCGKTSLSLLLAGVYRPWSGQILFDGYPLEEVPLEVFSDSVALVGQNPMCFTGTVRDNLKFWDPTIPDNSIVDAAQDAALHDIIVNRPGGYDGPVEEGGRNFSGGELQRLEIARALVCNPTLLILDEATSALDGAVELNIDRALRRRGCSCLIVAHRLSTIRDSDLIVVMQAGRIVQSGGHDQLVAEAGLYQRLIDVS